MERRAVIKLSTKFIEKRLGLPNSINIYAIDYDKDRDYIKIYITGDGVDVVPEGGEPIWTKVNEM